MKQDKLFVLLLLGTLSNATFAQVGINNSNPQQALHISGSGSGTLQPVIQIDGLNSINNTANENIGSQKRVYATSDGDLVILGNKEINKFSTTSPITRTKVFSGETAVGTQTFVLDYPSLVHFQARASLVWNDSGSPTNSGNFSDGKPRQMGFYFKFTSVPSGSGVSTTKGFGNSVNALGSYSSSNTTNAEQLKGQYYFNPSKDLYLPKGTYTVNLYAFLENPDIDYTVNTQSQTSQVMRVSITPVSY
ncbi:hypothetical protein [uncultured Chryseobacterium sp.]|uniref:hypothetical protein n=1 Tax=uncultured Chryseobacterium sp. TaxID=259322 RepID=UPI0025E3402B|nr:hypothetical protein [uncultured Chryseobacterium sp.]